MHLTTGSEPQRCSPWASAPSGSRWNLNQKCAVRPLSGWSAPVLELRNAPIKGPSGLARTLDRRGLQVWDTPLPPSWRPRGWPNVSVITYCALGRRVRWEAGYGHGAPYLYTLRERVRPMPKAHFADTLPGRSPHYQ